MRIPDWSTDKLPQPPALVDAIMARRGGALLNLDKALLWSEPLARGWNGYLKAVRTELSASRELRELAICTVALLTGAHYEYHHHAPDFLAAGGTQAQLDALQAYAASDLMQAPRDPAFSEVKAVVIHYASQMTRQVRVDEAVFVAFQRHFDTTQVVEITAAIATYNMVARFLVALQISPES
jgi:alkylhydroperoxidase family enzyme